MTEEGLTFGAFLRGKRLEKGISLRKFAEMTDLSPVHMSNIETDQRPAPSDEALERMAARLVLDKAELQRFYDLAAQSAVAPRVSGDLPAYIMGNELVRVALRAAKEADATDQEWMKFIEQLLERSGIEGELE